MITDTERGAQTMTTKRPATINQVWIVFERDQVADIPTFHTRGVFTTYTKAGTCIDNLQQENKYAQFHAEPWDLDEETPQ